MTEGSFNEMTTYINKLKAENENLRNELQDLKAKIYATTNGTRLIDANALKRDLIDNKNFYPVIVKNAIEESPAFIFWDK